jgi:DNA-binding CsgD family transcriptional regulator/nitrogen fixation/metabolism regulation signal transduction histidine kinase
MIRAIELLRSRSKIFRRAFLAIIIGEIFTILYAWLFLGFGIKLWLHTKNELIIQAAQHAATAADWSQVDRIPDDRESMLSDTYEKRLLELSSQYFKHLEGSVYLATIDQGEEDNIFGGPGGDDEPIQDVGKANQWERAAYAARKMTYTPEPIADSEGTYLAAYVPILRNGKVIGLVAAQYDSASLADFKSIVNMAFWFSALPAILVSVVVAAFLAARFVEPTDVLRDIEETAQNLRARSAEEEENDPWLLLSDREKELAELLRQGVESSKELAEATGLKPASIDTYFKRIKANTGYSKVALAVQAAARRSASAETIK